MQVQRIQNNYNPQFQGVLKVQNFKKGGKVTEIVTSSELDKGLSESALRNIFEGSWTNTGSKNLHRRKLAQYIEILKQTLGINIPQNAKDFRHIELKTFDNGYSIKAGRDYKITHIRDNN